MNLHIPHQLKCSVITKTYNSVNNNNNNNTNNTEKIIGSMNNQYNNSLNVGVGVYIYPTMFVQRQQHLCVDNT